MKRGCSGSCPNTCRSSNGCIGAGRHEYLCHGDIQGCHDSLLVFWMPVISIPAATAWLVGDLVESHGPSRSKRFTLRESPWRAAITVLGTMIYIFDGRGRVENVVARTTRLTTSSLRPIATNCAQSCATEALPYRERLLSRACRPASPVDSCRGRARWLPRSRLCCRARLSGCPRPYVGQRAPAWNKELQGLGSHAGHRQPP